MKRKNFRKFRLEDRLRMIRELDSLSGKRIARAGKTILTVLCIILVITTAYLILQTVGLADPGNAEEGKVSVDLFFNIATGKATATFSYNPKEVIDVLIGVVTVFITAVTAFQVYLMKDINNMEMSHQIFEDNQEYRQKMRAAHAQMRELALKIEENKKSKNPEEFDELYVRNEFSELRSMAFHYEYIGYLVFRNRLNFDIAFDTITFPNWLIASDEAELIITEGRKNTSDFWNGAEHLYRTYEVKRKYNNMDSADSATRKEAKKAYKLARENWIINFFRMPK